MAFVVPITIALGQIQSSGAEPALKISKPSPGNELLSTEQISKYTEMMLREKAMFCHFGQSEEK